MVNIQKILNKIGPLSSQQLVERFIGMLSSAGIHKLSEKEITRIRMFATDDCEAFLEESLTAYLSHGIVNIKKEKINHLHLLLSVIILTIIHSLLKRTPMGNKR